MPLYNKISSDSVKLKHVKLKHLETKFERLSFTFDVLKVVQVEVIVCCDKIFDIYALFTFNFIFDGWHP